MRLSKYIFFLLAILLIERLLDIWLFESPFIFVIFIIVFALIVGDMALWLPIVALSSLAFDLFSGLDYGLMTMALLIVYGTIYIAKRNVRINPSSYIVVSLSALLFTVQYFLTLSLLRPLLFGIFYEHIGGIFLSSLITIFVIALLLNGALYPKHS